MGSNAVFNKALKSALTFPRRPLHFRGSQPFGRGRMVSPVIMALMGMRGGGLLIHSDPFALIDLRLFC
jgi:hypothetical protein